MAWPDDPDKPQRQDVYLRALATIPHLTVHLGRFQVSTIRMRLAHPPVAGPNMVEVVKVEEKGSDVNLGAYLVADALTYSYEAAVVISNDADLAEPIRMVREDYGVPVGIFNPQHFRKRSGELQKVRPWFFRQIHAGDLIACQFPERLQDQRGEILRPKTW